MSCNMFTWCDEHSARSITVSVSSEKCVVAWRVCGKWLLSSVSLGREGFSACAVVEMRCLCTHSPLASVDL